MEGRWEGESAMISVYANKLPEKRSGYHDIEIKYEPIENSVKELFIKDLYDSLKFYVPDELLEITVTKIKDGFIYNEVFYYCTENCYKRNLQYAKKLTVEIKGQEESDEPWFFNIMNMRSFADRIKDYDDFTNFVNSIKLYIQSLMFTATLKKDYNEVMITTAATKNKCA